MMKESQTLPCALTIAGSDSGGGAGVQADLKTMGALGVFGTSAITAVTAQNTRGVTSWRALPATFVAEQVRAVLEDLPVLAIKTGMLGTSGVIRAVSRALDTVLQGPRAVPLVVDPVVVATSGDPLLSKGAERALLKHLVARATVVTPNLPEASLLLGRQVTTLLDMREAAAAFVELGAKAALVKGGHMQGDPVDVLYWQGRFEELSSPRIDTTSTHGTGCTLSSAIASYLARGLALDDAVRGAHAYVHEAIQQAPGLGHGHGPVHHFHPFYGARGIS